MLYAHEYEVVIRTKQPLLGSKPTDPSILTGHLIETARKGVREYAKSTRENTKAAGLPFVGMEEISDEEVKKTVQRLRTSIEDWMGEPCGNDEWDQFCKEGFGKNTMLYSKIQELKGATIIYKDEEGFPFLEGYVIKGFFKNAAQMYTRRLNRPKRGEVFGSYVYTAKVFNEDFWIPTSEVGFYSNEECTTKARVKTQEKNQKSKMYTRPLRGMTAQGERVMVAASEYIATGAYLKFKVKHYMDKLDKKILTQLLAIGEDHGLGQWRTSGKGSFELVSLKKL